MDQQRSPTVEEESLLACGWDPDLQMEACPRTPPPGHAPNPSQYQSLFQGVNSSHEVAKVLEFQLQYQSFQ